MICKFVLRCPSGPGALVYIGSGWIGRYSAGINAELEGIRMGNESGFDYCSSRWKRKRAAILRKQNYMCANCKKYGRMREAVEVHHIKHVDEYPELAFDDGNLVGLCKMCHLKQHPERGKHLSQLR